jgi:hypothetical protein
MPLVTELGEIAALDPSASLVGDDGVNNLHYTRPLRRGRWRRRVARDA